MKIKPLYIVLVIASLFAACKSDIPTPVSKTSFTGSKSDSSVYIICEGNYTWGNASVSYYNSKSGDVSDDLFKQKNNKDLGDVCESMTIFDGKAFLMVNNSAKIEVVDPVTFNSIATIHNINSPRYFSAVNTSKAYVTNIYGDSISVINIQTYQKTKSIYCKGWTEKLINAGTKTYVCNQKSKYIYIIDNQTDIINDSILVGNGTSDIVADKNNNLWAISTYDTPYNLPSKLLKINTETNKITQQLTINNTVSARNLCINHTGDTLYYNHNGVYKMGISEPNLPTIPIIAQPSGSTFYGLGIEPSTNNVYIADALDYNQQGLIKRYTNQGIFVAQFKVGYIPNGFVFR